MAVRQFWLENANGIKYSLHRVESFLNTPSGLGYGVDISTFKLGDSNVIATEEYNLGSVEGEILFMEEREKAYQQYFQFAQFLYARPITLHYVPPNTFDGYHCQVRITNVEKGEVNSDDGILHVPVSMYRQTMWYTDKENVISVKAEYEDGKEYPLDRPYHYGMFSTNGMILTNNGVANAPLIIEVDGASSDVMWRLFDANYNLYGACRIIGDYDYVYVNSNDLEEEIRLVDNDVFLPNAINYQDLTVGDPRNVFVTFLKLRPGQSRLAFNLTDEFTGTVTVRWRNAYVTV